MVTYSIPFQTHDYEATDDYDQISVSAKVQGMVDEIVQRLHATLVPALGIFTGFTVAFVDCRGLLGRYASGTVSYPVVLLDWRAFEEATKKLSVQGREVDIPTEVEKTILHALGCAVQEAYGYEYFDTAEAEAFATEYAEFQKVRLPRDLYEDADVYFPDTAE